MLALSNVRVRSSGRTRTLCQDGLLIDSCAFERVHDAFPTRQTDQNKDDKIDKWRHEA